ncbi:4-oxalocrotonate tautomerase [Undibacterium sp. TS12]|uniref:tautomerase family protein n=1 Tax=Undibacterium sp. TS12 TaxID=2908202 RepID=UPI001F4CFF66|nr:4-oxalocrotonate tautomerase [Undibacterium sp. TS12]MCH8620947.1 4-oxalocrotonate tautomerase [Undibacterium sp. TS12]
MPISVQVTTGLLTQDGEREVLPLVADALLRVHGLTGNKFMTPNVVGHLVVSPEARSYAGGKLQSLAVIEVKVPAVTFPNADVKQAFISEVTDIIDRLKKGTHPQERTYVNVTYAVDGTWGIAGKAYSNSEMGEAVQQGFY